jgi:hypothetical protein
VYFQPSFSKNAENFIEAEAGKTNPGKMAKNAFFARPPEKMSRPPEIYKKLMGKSAKSA